MPWNRSPLPPRSRLGGTLWPWTNALGPLKQYINYAFPVSSDTVLNEISAAAYPTETLTCILKTESALDAFWHPQRWL